MSSFQNVLILSSFFLIVFGISEIAYRFFKINAEYTRKWSHIASGFLALLFPFMIDDVLWVGIICGIFLLILNFSKPLGLLPSINAVNRKTYGSILFPLAVFISFVAYTYNDKNLVYFLLPVLTLAISDMAAAIIGKRYPIRSITTFKEKKSIGGYLAFTISCYLIYGYFLYFDWEISMLTFIILPPLVAMIELVSPKGLDNISIPLSVIIGLIFLN